MQLDPAIQPACLPITSRINTFVEVSHIDSTSKAASIVEVTMYLATEPNPGQSVTARSLSTVFRYCNALKRVVELIAYL